MKHVSIHDALKDVTERPFLETDELTQVKMSELICRTLFDIANRPDANVRGSAGRANKARKMILDRLVGKRRAGSHPATREEIQLEFVDLAATPEVQT